MADSSGYRHSHHAVYGEPFHTGADTRVTPEHFIELRERIFKVAKECGWGTVVRVMKMSNGWTRYRAIRQGISVDLPPVIQSRS